MPKCCYFSSLRDLGIEPNNMSMIVGATKTELISDESVLPSEDFKLYLMPKQTKSGFERDSEEIYDEIAENFRNLAVCFQELSGRVANNASEVVKPFVNAQTIEDLEDLEDLKEFSNSWNQ